MLRNFFKIAIRNIAKQKFYSALNILGLTIGMAGTLMAILYVSDELSYDQFHSDIDRMYRVGLHGKIAGQDIRVTSTCAPMSVALVAEIPEIDESIRISQRGNFIFTKDDKTFTEDEILIADSNFFEFFNFRVIQGDSRTALKEPNSIVFTESMLSKYLDTEEAVGKIITIGNDKTSYKITAVMEDVPQNSHFKFDYILSAASFEYLKSTTWLNNNLITYFKLVDNGNLENVKESLDKMVVTNIGPELEQMMGVNLTEFKAQGGEYGYFIDPMKDIHLYSHLDGEFEANGDIMYVYIFSAVGLFILLIACINFMNLSTARSAGRAKEVGLRKTLGSRKTTLVRQFLLESMIYSLLAISLALLVVYVAMPAFNTLAGKEMQFSALFQPVMISSIVGISLIVGLLAGSYPAFYLTSFEVADVLKGKTKSGVKSGGLRNVLVVVQFSISIFLIIGTSIVYQQLQYAQNVNLGFNKEQLLIVRNTNRLDNDRDAFKNSLTAESRVAAASYSNNLIPGVNNTTVFRSVETEEDHILATYGVDYEQIDAMQFKLASGRNFSRDFPSDSTTVLINEAAAVEFGWENPVGMEMMQFFDDVPAKAKVIGVIKDFNYESLKTKVRPLVIYLVQRGNVMTVRFNSVGNIQESIALVENKWNVIAPNESFEYNFLDEDFDALYRSEQRIGRLFTVFSGLAIIIACLGLLGLAAYVAEQRTKEIGVRKALGASTIGIIALLSKEFTKFVLIAFVFAIIPAYFMASNWLQNFEYRIEVGIGVFVLGGAMALIIAWITVGLQSIKAALLSPSKSLKYE